VLGGERNRSIADGKKKLENSGLKLARFQRSQKTKWEKEEREGKGPSSVGHGRYGILGEPPWNKGRKKE